MIPVKSYSKGKDSKGRATSSGSSPISLKIADAAKKLVETHTIWGQEFNGTDDVDGDLKSNGVVDAAQGLST